MITACDLHRSPQGARWESLHFLRAVASVGVVAHHVPQFLFARVDYTLRSFEAGAAGVDIFFCISGFVMYCATARSPQRWQDFLAKRAIRLLPMYWLVTLAVTAAVWCVPSAFAHFRVTGEQLAKSLVFVPILDSNGDIRPVIAVGWTLHFELLFYALIAVALPFVATRASLIAAAAVSVIAALCLLLRLPQPHSAWQLLGPITVEFALGVGLAHVLNSTSVLQTRLALRATMSCAALACAGWLISSVTPQGVGLERLQYWGVGGFAITSAFALLEPELRLSGRIRHIYGPLGDASYSLYLIHGSVFPIVWKLLSESYRSHRTLTWLTLFIVPILVSLPAHYWVEAVLTRSLTRIGKDSSRLFPRAGSPDGVERYGG